MDQNLRDRPIITSRRIVLGALRFPSDSSSFYGLEPDTVNVDTVPLISSAVVGRMNLVPYMLFVFF
jgi:hypothetical protein